MSHFINNVEIYSNNYVIQAQMDTIVKAPKLVKYINDLDLTVIDVTNIRIDAVTWFCAPTNIAPEKLGFLYMEVECKSVDTDKPLPGVVFLRGGSVAVYIVVDVEGQKYVILTEQVRVPYGTKTLEIPAGMLNADGDFTSVAMKEITEETGLHTPNIHELKPLGNPIVPSPGGCDEEVHLFFWETTAVPEIIDKMKETIYGLHDENESIRLVFIPLEQYASKLASDISDAKTICAHLRATQMGFVKF